MYGYVSERRRESLELSFRSQGITPHLTQIQDNITFEYLHPLSRPTLTPPFAGIAQNPAINVEGETILRFGMLEGSARTKGRRVIYDPQTGDVPEAYQENGSEAEELAVVLNENEALKIGGSDAAEAASIIRREWNAKTVVVKLGTRGALVTDADGNETHVLPFRSERVFKIGSGDVFSAVFAHCWGVEGASPQEAARMASHAVADYVESRSLPLTALARTNTREEVEDRERGQIYLAGPFFDISQRWLINESQMIIDILGVGTFSPIHDVGPASSESDVAIRDLKGLDESNVVLAFVDSRDPGTLLEVGYAINARKEVVILTERLPEHELTMFSVPNCHVCRDFSTALYKAAWLA